MSKSARTKRLPGNVILESLNPSVKIGGKASDIEEAYLRTLLFKAAKEGKFHAIKKLLEIFDEAGALGEPPITHGIIRIPEYFDDDSYIDWFFSADRNKARLKLSKTGERKQAEFVKDKANLEDAWNFWMPQIRLCEKRIESNPHPFYRDGMEFKEYRSELNKLNREELDYIAYCSSQIRLRAWLIDRLQDEFDTFNQKWSRHYTIPGLKRAGYKKPPEHRQFKEGESGNPAGRPRKPKDRKTQALKLAAEIIDVTQEGKTSRKPVAQVVFDCLLRAAMSGNSRAEKLRDHYMEKYNPSKRTGGFLVLPADDLTDDEFLEALEAHRKKSDEDLQRLKEEHGQRGFEDPGVRGQDNLRTDHPKMDGERKRARKA